MKRRFKKIKRISRVVPKTALTVVLVLTFMFSGWPPPKEVLAAAPVIESGDITGSGNNGTTDATPDISYPATVNAGDLLIFWIGVDQQYTLTPPGNLTNIMNDNCCTAGPTMYVGYEIADGTEDGSTLAFTLSTADSYDGGVIRVPAGEFDASDPIGNVSSVGKGTSGTDPTADMPAFTGDRANARVVAIGAIDLDPMDATFSPTGWTDRYDNDRGAVATFVSTRDAETSAGESISGAAFGINTGDSNIVIGFEVNEPVADPDVNQIHYRWRNDDGGESGTDTLNLQVSIGNDDGHANSNGASGTITETHLRVGNNSNPLETVARFNNVTIDQGAVISSATFTLTSQDTYDCGGCTLTTTVHAEDSDNSASLTVDNMHDRTPTTASTVFNATTTVLNSEYEIDVTDAVQEVIDRGGWSSGNSMSILVIDNGSDFSEWQQYFSYDGSTTKAPKLDITYGSGSGATWATTEDTAFSDIAKETPYRLRFELSNEGAGSDNGATHQLEVAETGTCSSGTYAPVPTDTSGDWQIVGSSNITDGEATSNIASGLTDEATTFVSGELKDTGNTTGTITLDADEFTEIEFSLQATTNATDGGDYCFRLTNTDTYTVYAVASIAGGSVTFTQNSYRFYVDNDATNPTEVWGAPDIAENTAISMLPPGNDPPGADQEVRLRINITVGGGTLSSSSQQFKLQYKAGTDGSCTTGSWSDVAGSATWEYATSSVTDGTTITGTLTSTDVNGQYAKSSPTTANANSVSAGEDIEYDFHLIGANISGATKYSLRVVESDGTEFGTYTNCPTLTTEPGTANLIRHGNVFSDGVEQGFFWAD